MSNTRRVRVADSATSSATVRAPRSCASPISASRTSAVACASGSARWHGCTEVPKKYESCASDARGTRPASTRRASATVSTTGAASRDPVSRSVSRSRNDEIETRVVRDEYRVAREAHEPLHRLRCARRPAQLPVGEPGDRGDRRAERRAGIDERLELVDDLEADDLDRSDLADLRRAGAQAGRLEIDDDVRRVLEQEVDAERPGQRDRVAVPREPRVGLDDLGEKRARERDRRLAEREEPARRLLGDDRPAPLLDELHEPVGGV